MAKMSRQSQAAWKGFLPPSSQQTLRKGLWSPEEDEKLLAYLSNKNTLDCSWTCVAKQAGLQRCGKSCRLRWVNYLRPGVKRGAFSREEERLMINLQSILGNRWSHIALHMPGRTDNEIKNYWNSSIKKNLKSKHHISSHSAAPYMDVVPEGHQTPNNTFNVVPTGQNRLCVPALLELQQEQVQDRNNEINHLTSYFQMSMNDTSANNHDSVVSTRVAFQGSSNADNWCDVANPGDYTGQGTRFRVAEDSECLYENTTDQSCPKLNFHTQFDGTEIILPAEVFQSEDECKDSLNLRYDINMADPNYIDIYSGQKYHRRGVGDHRDCLIIPHQKMNSNPVSTISSAGRGNGPLEIECEWEADQVTVSPHDDLYNLNIAAASELGQIYYDLDEIYFS